MVTGASTANLAIILVDARKGVIEQTRRHSYIASLLRIPHLVVCVNKMDLVDYSEDVFKQVQESFNDFSTRLQLRDITIIPISALRGDNVVEYSDNMPWYHGGTLLSHLEEVHIANDRNLHDPRLPVQWVVRPQSDAYHDFRGFAGQIAGGAFSVGDKVVVLPSGRTSRVSQIYTLDGTLDRAYTPMSVTLCLEDEIDISRGDMIARPDNTPYVRQDVDVMMCWMHEQPMQVGRKYAFKHTSKTGRCVVRSLPFRVDIQTLERDPEAETLALNEIGRVSLMTTVPLAHDAYSRNRYTGSLVLIDEATNITVGAGLICEPTKAPELPAYEGYVI